MHLRLSADLEEEPPLGVRITRDIFLPIPRGRAFVNTGVMSENCSQLWCKKFHLCVPRFYRIILQIFTPNNLERRFGL
jgi:hypothetical protein